MNNLTPHQRRILPLFAASKEVTTKGIALFFDVSERQARHICNLWVKEKFIEIANSDPESRTYRLSGRYERLLKSLVL